MTVRPGTPDLLARDECARVVLAAIDAAGAPAGATVSLTLSDDAELASLNEMHMGKTGPTDVLSFPLLPASIFPGHLGQDPGAQDLAEPAAKFTLPPDQPLHLGDVIVSVERAIKQAETGGGGQTGEVRWSPAEELRLLITHGGLHLCGWDHVAKEEETAMRALERQLLGIEISR